jgi:transcriptional regulator with XRE-family HTH domain
MKDRIRQIMESMHMTQNVFAQFLDMSPASLSSIFNDRTKPTLNTVEAIKKKIPDINIDWLMFGTGQMFGSTPSGDDTQMDANEGSKGSLYDENRSTPSPSVSSSPMFDFVDAPSGAPRGVVTGNSVRNTRLNTVQQEVKIPDKPQRRVVEIRVYYDDQTWESFAPSKK